MIATHRRAIQPHGIARHRHPAEHGPLIARHEQVHKPPTPAARAAFHLKGLPHGLLVIVGEQLGRPRPGPAEIAGLAERPDQWADVGHHRQTLGVEEVPHAAHHRVEGQAFTTSRGHTQGTAQALMQHRTASLGRRARSGQRDLGHATAHAVVALPGAGVGAQHHVHGVVAAGHEDTHQRFVARGTGGRSIAHGRQTQAQAGGSRGHQAQCRGPAQHLAARKKISALRHDGAHFWTMNSGLTSVRVRAVSTRWRLALSMAPALLPLGTGIVTELMAAKDSLLSAADDNPGNRRA